MQEEKGQPTTFDYPVVAVGASAGGIEALKTLAECIPADTRATFIILQHLAPDHESQLVNILSRVAKLPCQEAAEDIPVNAGNIYVLPPDRYLSIHDHGLFVELPQEPRGSRMPIDYFMRSLAETTGSKAIGVVLSGTGSDGAAGLRAIRGAGGITFAQSPETALYDGMPRAAIDSGNADQVGTIAQIADSIAGLARNGAKGTSEEFTLKDLGPVLALLRARANFDFSAYKVGTLGRRVKRRMNLLRVSTLSKYVDVLREQSDEVSQLFDDLLINVTAFFRDDVVWDEVRKKVVKPLASDATSYPLRIWVPACSTGEEAYTLAIMVDECCREHSLECDWQIFATDLDAAAIARAREALYPASISADLSEERLSRYFRKDARGFRVEKQLRERVMFARQDILSDPPFSRLDLVSCRNLMIYLNPANQAQVLDTFQFALKEHGFLVLGTSETVSSRAQAFKTVSGKAHIYKRKPGPAAAHFTARQTIDNSPRDGNHADISRRSRSPDLTETVRRSIFDRYAPAGVVIDPQGTILHYTGPVQRFIETPEGEPRNNLFEVTPGSLRARIREAMRRASGEGGDELSPVLVRFSDRDQLIKVECVSIGTDKDQPQFLVTFLEEDEPRTPASPESDDSKEYIQHLEAELEIVREDLQTTVEELETSNEELKASNEEAMAANEELQSANEELETSREELQSLNEELVTVNHQLEDKIDEVEKTSDDLRNLLASTRLPVLFLDTGLNISSYTDTIKSLIEVREGDVGRPVAELAFKITDEALVDDAKSVLKDLQPIEKQVRGSEQRSFLRRIQPYRTGDERIGGVVVTFTDVTEQASVARRLAMRERQARIVAELSRSALSQRDTKRFMDDTVVSLRAALRCDYSKILQLDEGGETFSLIAGSGWNNDLAGQASVPGGLRSQAGYTLRSDNGVLVTDLQEEARFDGPALLVDHRVRSGVSTVIHVGGKAWGVIGLHSMKPNHFSEEDLDVLRIAADVIALAIMQSQREEHLARERLSLALALKAADLGVWTYNVDTGEVTWDEHLRQMTGLGKSHPTPKLEDFLKHIHPDDREAVQYAVDNTLETGEPFTTEFRFTRPDGETVWLRGKSGRISQRGDRVLIGVNADVTKRRLAEEQRSFMMRELDHRVKNLFAIILSIAELTSRSADDLATFRKAFSSRLHAMARTHTTLADSRWAGADLKKLLEEEVAGHGSEDRVVLHGPKISITPSCAQALSMLFHELMTNAIKYGALSVANGMVSVRWRLDRAQPDLLQLTWEETGGPAARAPESAGFGTKVMDRVVGDQLSANVESKWLKEGLVFSLSFDLAPFIPGGTVGRKTNKRPVEAEPEVLKGKTILVLDDEWLIAEQHADVLTTVGARILGPFTRLADAMDQDFSKVDAALLDFSLEDGNSLPLARELHEAGTPIAFVTGYGPAMHLNSPFDKCPVITKPANAAAILNGAARLISQAMAAQGEDE